jgi:hypothetical protein
LEARKETFTFKVRAPIDVSCPKLHKLSKLPQASHALHKLHKLFVKFSMVLKI